PKRPSSFCAAGSMRVTELSLPGDWSTVSLRRLLETARSRASGPAKVGSELAHKPKLVAKPRTHFVCQSCGFQAAKCLGTCPDRGNWNSLVEEMVRAESHGGSANASADSRPVRLSDVVTSSEIRRCTEIKELDRVLGGGVVPGSFVLLGGDPGIGK